MAEILYRPNIDHLPTGCLVVNVARLAQQVQEGLKREHQ
jgi:hypothetical protein